MRGPLALTRSLAAVGLTVSALIAATGCSSAPGSNTTGPNPGNSVASITFAADSLVGDSLPITPGDSAQITATPLDAHGQPVSGVTLVWTSSDTTVATVTATGLVRSIDLGEADITATPSGSSSNVANSMASYKGADASHYTRADGVVSTRGARSKIKAWSNARIIVTPANDTINVGDQIMFTSTPVNASGKTPDRWTVKYGSRKWSSKTPSIASIDGTGLATGVSPGTTTITGSMIVSGPSMFPNSYAGYAKLTVRGCGGVTAVPSWTVSTVVSTYNPATVSEGPVSYMINQKSHAMSGKLGLVYYGPDSTGWHGVIFGTYAVNNTSTTTGGPQPIVTTETGSGQLASGSEITFTVYNSGGAACTYRMEYADYSSVTTTPAVGSPHTEVIILGDLNLFGNVPAPPAAGQLWDFVAGNASVPASLYVPLTKTSYYVPSTTLSAQASGIANTTAQAQFEFKANPQ